jgi:CRP/FNR family transcriptional regulator
MSSKKTKRNESLVEASSLSGIDLFQGLPASCLEAVEQNSKVREFRAGHAFFRPGESGQVLFFLEKGRVQTFRVWGKKKLIIAELKPPAVFGEMGCIGQGMYHCSAETVETSRIRMISRTKLEALPEEYPKLTRQLLELVGRRFVNVLQDLEATSFRQLIPRLANLLLVRAVEDSVRGLTHREMAELLGVYRESATAALGELRNAGIVSLGRKEIQILDHLRLERAARE